MLWKYHISYVLMLLLFMVRDSMATWAIALTLYGYADVLTSLPFSLMRKAEKCNKVLAVFSCGAQLLLQRIVNT